MSCLELDDFGMTTYIQNGRCIIADSEGSNTVTKAVKKRESGELFIANTIPHSITSCRESCWKTIENRS